MPAPRPIPPALFRSGVTTQEARALGVTADQAAGARLARPTRGVVVARELIGDLRGQCHAIAMALPADHAWSHSTAAHLLSLPLPPQLLGLALHVSVAAPCVVPRRRGLVSHGVWLPARHVTSVDGVRCTIAARCFADLAPQLALDDLVALGDAALRSGRADHDEVIELLAGATRRRGVRRARRAATLLDGRAESAPESRVRVWLELAQLPRFEPQLTILGDGGRPILRADLGNEDFRVLVEYQGAYHRDRAAFASDVRRRSRLRDLGYDVIEVEANMMRSPVAVVREVARGLARRGWRGRPRPFSELLR